MPQRCSGFKAIQDWQGVSDSDSVAEGNDCGKEGAANIQTCALLLNNSANEPVVVNHE